MNLKLHWGKQVNFPTGWFESIELLEIETECLEVVDVKEEEVEKMGRVEDIVL